MCIYSHTKDWANLTVSCPTHLAEILFSGMMVYRRFSSPLSKSFFPVTSKQEELQNIPKYITDFVK